VSLPEGFSLGPYRIVSLIGRGGMASVYKGHHRALDRDVAIKVLPEFFAEDETYQERFHQEARSVARLNHPNILTVFDFGQEMGVTYLVLELVQGGTLAERLGRPMELEEVIRILRPIASALDYAHSQGVLHRDLKPSNILIHRDGTPVLADFGLAKMIDSGRRLTASGLVLGTPEYMSPEQSTGEEIGPPSDRYALAVVAYEMLTGSIPFEGQGVIELLYAHVHLDPARPSALRPELNETVDAVIMRGLAKEPRSRWGSCEAFVTALAGATVVYELLSLRAVV